MADALQKVAEGRRWDNVMPEDARMILSDESFLSNMLIATPDGQDTLLHMVAITEDQEVVKMVIEAYVKHNMFKDCMKLENKYFRTPLQAAVIFGHTNTAIELFEECLRTCPEIITTYKDGNTLLHNACGLTDCVATLKYLIRQEICQPMLLMPWSTREIQLLPVDVAQDLVAGARDNVRIAERAKKPNRREIERRKQKLQDAEEILYTIEGPTRAAKRENQK